MGSTLLKHQADHDIYVCRCGRTYKSNCEELFCMCGRHVIFPQPEKRTDKKACELCGCQANSRHIIVKSDRILSRLLLSN